MTNDAIKKILVAGISAIALLSALAPSPAHALNVPVHTSSIKKSAGSNGGIESKFLKECSTEVAKANHVIERPESKFGYNFDASQIKRVEACVDAKLEASKPSVADQAKGISIFIGVLASTSFGLSWVFNGGLDQFNISRRMKEQGLSYNDLEKLKSKSGGLYNNRPRF